LGDPTAATNRVNLAGGTLTYNGSQNDTAHGGTTSDPRMLTVPNKLRVSNGGTISYNSTTTGLTDTGSDINGIQFFFSNDTIDWTGGTLTFLHDGVSQGITFRPTFSGSGFNYAGPVVVDNGAGTRKTVLTSTNGASTTQTWSGDMTAGTNGGTYLREVGGTTVLGGSTVSVGITNKSEIVFDRSTTQLFSGAMTGAGNLTKNGIGTLTVTGTSNYTGSTSLNQGVTLVNGSLTGTSGVTVSSGATLGGIGSISSAVTNNGTIAPGASVGTLTTGAVTMADNSHLLIELGSIADRLTVNGNLDLSSALDALDFSGLPSLAGSWTLVSYSGTRTGTFDTVTNLPAGYTLNYGAASNSAITLVAPSADYNGDTNVNLADYVTWRKDPGSFGNDPNGYARWRESFTPAPVAGPSLDGAAAVPEPATLSLVLLGLGLIAGSRRRKN
jgi:autotransporter-associated beta strand protein